MCLKETSRSVIQTIFPNKFCLLLPTYNAFSKNVSKAHLHESYQTTSNAFYRYYDRDVDLSVLNGKQIVFLGYYHQQVYPIYPSRLIVFCTSFGNQGAAQAQNLRDSGTPNEKILIANREDAYADDAKSKGFIVEHSFEKAASVADSEDNQSDALLTLD